MHGKICIICFVLLFNYGLVFAQADSVTSAQIDRVYKKFSEGYVKLDPVLVGECYTDDAIGISHYSGRPPKILDGKKTIIYDFTFFFNRLKQEKKQVGISFLITKRTIFGNRAYDIGFYKLVSIDSIGNARNSYGKIAIVLIKQKNKSWKFLTDTNSSSNEDEYERAKKENDSLLLLSEKSGKINFTLSGNHPFIKVLVNDKPLNFMLDMGASGFGRIDERIVKTMGLDTVGYQDNSDGINTTKLPLIGVKSLKVGGIEMKNLELMSRNYNRTQREIMVDGIIGREFFEQYLLTVDYPKREIEYSKNNLDPTANNVLTYDRPFIVKGKLGQKEYEFFLDTGSNIDFHFPKKVIDELKYDTTGERRQARRANTEFTTHGVMIREKLHIGKVDVENFHAFYSEPQTWINVGSSFLKSYRLTIDQKNKCLTIE